MLIEDATTSLATGVLASASSNDRRSDLVVVHVRDDVVHALAHTDGRCQVQHHVDSPQSALDRSRIDNIANEQIGFSDARYAGGRSRAGP